MSGPMGNGSTRTMTLRGSLSSPYPSHTAARQLLNIRIWSMQRKLWAQWHPWTVTVAPVFKWCRGRPTIGSMQFKMDTYTVTTSGSCSRRSSGPVSDMACAAPWPAIKNQIPFTASNSTAGRDHTNNCCREQNHWHRFFLMLDFLTLGTKRLLPCQIRSSCTWMQNSYRLIYANVLLSVVCQIRPLIPTPSGILQAVWLFSNIFLVKDVLGEGLHVWFKGDDGGLHDGVPPQKWLIHHASLNPVRIHKRNAHQAQPCKSYPPTPDHVGYPHSVHQQKNPEILSQFPNEEVWSNMGWLNKNQQSQTITFGKMQWYPSAPVGEGRVKFNNS